MIDGTTKHVSTQMPVETYKQLRVLTILEEKTLNDIMVEAAQELIESRKSKEK